jgi:hypothetical protein
MLLLAAAIVSATPAQASEQRPVSASVQARATIRVISGARLRLGKVVSNDPFLVRDAVIRSAGTPQPARLFEFQ